MIRFGMNQGYRHRSSFVETDSVPQTVNEIPKLKEYSRIWKAVKLFLFLGAPRPPGWRTKGDGRARCPAPKNKNNFTAFQIRERARRTASAAAQRV